MANAVGDRPHKRGGVSSFPAPRDIRAGASGTAVNDNMWNGAVAGAAGRLPAAAFRRLWRRGVKNFCETYMAFTAWPPELIFPASLHDDGTRLMGYADPPLGAETDLFSDVDSGLRPPTLNRWRAGAQS